MAQVFPVSTVLAVSGLDQRQLRRLEQLGVVQPSVVEKDGGWPALYSFRDLVRLRVASEMLERDMNAPEVRRLIDDLEDHGIDDPLTTIRFVGDPEAQRDSETGRRWHGRVFVVDPQSDEPRSAHHFDQSAELYDLVMRDLTVELEGTIEELTQRRTGTVEKARNVRGSEWVVAGTRVPVRLIQRLAQDGWSTDRILQSYPSLVAEDVQAAVRHSAAEPQAVA